MQWPCPPALSLCLHGLSCCSATGAFVKPCLHWWRLHDNASDSDSHYLLALATLGNTTQIGLFLFLVTSPKVDKASTVRTVTCRCHRQFCFANFANVNDPSQWNIIKIMVTYFNEKMWFFSKYQVSSGNDISRTFTKTFCDVFDAI
jgi:hypothetical protein